MKNATKNNGSIFYLITSTNVLMKENNSFSVQKTYICIKLFTFNEIHIIYTFNCSYMEFVFKRTRKP